MILCAGCLLALVVVSGAAPAAAVGGKAPWRAITDVTILTGSGEIISPGTVLYRDGLIEAVGKKVRLPEGTKVTSEKGKVLLPGLVAADTVLSTGPWEDEPSLLPEIVAFDGFDFFDRYRLQLASGTTCAYLSPGRIRLIAGQGSVARLGAAPQRALVSRTAALDAVLTAEALSPPGLFKPEVYPRPSKPFPHVEEQLPHTRASQIAELRRFLQSDEPIVARLKKKELPLRVRADSVREIRAALRLAADYGVRLIIVGGREAGELAGQIKARKAAVVWLCTFSAEQVDARDVPADPRRLAAARDTLRKLARAGVEVAIVSAGGEGRDLLSAAAYAVAHGFPREKAIAAITAGAAHILGVDDRVGRIEDARAADFVLLNGMPFAEGATVVKTFVGGRLVYEHEAEKRNAQRGDVVLRDALVLTGDGGRFPDTDILIEKGTIVTLGSNLRAPERAEEIDLRGKVVIPGMIDLASRLGTHFVRGNAEAEEVPSFSGDETFLLSLGEVIRHDEPAFRACVEEGILGLVVRGGSGTLVAGTGAYILPGAGPPDFLARPFACLDIDISGSSRASRLSSLRSLLRRLAGYEKARESYEEALEEYGHRKPRDKENRLKEPMPPSVDATMERLLEARKRELPLFVRAERGDEITDVLTVLAEEGGYVCALVDAAGIGRAENVARMTRGVILTPPYQRWIEGKRVDLPRLLAEKDIPFALASGGATGSLHLRYYAGEAVRRGLSPDLALRSVTSVPAKLLGLSGRYGMIAAGRRANLVVLDGEVFAPGSRVLMVLIHGKVAFRRSSP